MPLLAALHAHMCGSPAAPVARTALGHHTAARNQEGRSGDDGAEEEQEAAAAEAVGGGQRWAWEILTTDSWLQHLLSWRSLARSTWPPELLHRQEELRGLKKRQEELKGGLSGGQTRTTTTSLKLEAPRPTGESDNGTQKQRQAAEDSWAASAHALPLTLAFIFVGTKSLPHYVLKTVEQARKTHGGPTMLVVSQGATEDGKLLAWAARHDLHLVSAEQLPATAHHLSFSRVSPLDRQGRGGLWHHAAERLFILEELMLAWDLEDIVSAECDCLIYRCCSELNPKP
jgi:hypothetical protein